MELTKLINGIHTIQVSGNVERKDVNGIFYDSRKVKRGSLFVAIKGLQYDGHKYIMDAVNKGAMAVILEDDKAVPDYMLTHANITKILVRDTRQALAEASHYYCKEPSLKLKLIGITGTNGKTTTTWLIKNILEKLGHKCGLIGTIANYISDVKIPTEMTTPESCDLNQILFDMVEAGCQYAIMEVSSHSLDLKRVHGLKFRTALFSNLTQDHLDFHGTFENYLNAKKKLFDSLEPEANAFLNVDDKASESIAADCAGKVITYGQNQNADLKISDIKFDLEGTSFLLQYEGRTYPVQTSLVGEFNAYNLSAAIAACIAEGYTPDQIIPLTKSLPQVPGRFEVVSGAGKKVVIDYSHTPDSLEKILQNVRKLTIANQPIVTVFGCGGNRDKTKRPIMGKIAAELSDIVYVTSDNPRKEEPLEIINDIIAGNEGAGMKVVPLREEAIARAIAESPDNSVIVIAGKGHEDYQIIGETKHHFSDREMAERYLKSTEVI